MKNNIEAILLRNKLRMAEGPRNQSELAQRINKDESYVSLIVNNKLIPGGEVLLAIAEALGLSIEEVFFKDEHEAEKVG